MFTTMVLEIIHKHSPHRERFTSKFRIPDILYIAMDCFAQDNVLVTVIAHCESNASVQQAEKGYNCADERTLALSMFYNCKYLLMHL